jgi:hypothetical protein
MDYSKSELLKWGNDRRNLYIMQDPKDHHLSNNCCENPEMYVTGMAS